MSFHETEGHESDMSRSVVQTSEADSCCEYTSSHSDGSSAASDEGEGEGDDCDGDTEGIMDYCS